MSSVRDVAMALAAYGYWPIPLRYKSKQPTAKSWQNQRLRDDFLSEAFPIDEQQGIGVLLGVECHPTQFLMCVDIDLEDLTLIGRIHEALGQPRLPAKRGKKGITFFVRVEEQMRKRLFKRENDGGELEGQVEILGYGQQTVLPPSLHPDTHNHYEWVTSWGDPLEETPVEALPLMTTWMMDEIGLATIKPESKFFDLNIMSWLGPSGGGTVHDTLLAAIGVMVQRKWPRDAISERCGRAVRNMLRNCEFADQWDWDVFNDVLSKMTEGAVKKGFDKGASKRASRSDLQNEAVNAAISEFGGVDKIGLIDGLFRVYSDGWWQEWNTDRLMRLVTQHPRNWDWITAADAKAVVQKIQYAAQVRHRRPVDRVMTRSGPLDMQTNMIVNPDPEDLFTYILPFDYDPEAKCPTYDKFMRQLFSYEGAAEGDIRRAIHTFEEYAGLTFVPDTSFQKALILQGPPQTGKSTLLRLMEAMHAPTSRASLDLFELRSERTLVSLAGRLVSFTFEISPDEFVPADVFKQLADGSTMAVRLLYAEKYDVRMMVRMVIACNEMFRYRDSSGAMERRMLILRTRPTIQEGRRNRALLGELIGEAPGIFNRWMEGLRRLRRQDHFTAPRYMKEELETAAEASDPVLRWLHDRTHEGMALIDRGYEVPEHEGTLSTELYLDFKEWLADRGHKPMTDVSWGTRVSQRGYPSIMRRVKTGVIRMRQLKLVRHGSF